MAEAGEAEDGQATLVRNERLKARATYLNGLAVAILAVGALAPIAASISTFSRPSIAASILAFICVLLSYGLHYFAMNVLEGLRL